MSKRATNQRGILSADVQVNAALKGLRGLLMRSSKLTPVFKSLKRPLKTDQRAHYMQERGPDGKRWARRADLTHHLGDGSERKRGLSAAQLRFAAKLESRRKPRKDAKPKKPAKTSGLVLKKLPWATGYTASNTSVTGKSKVKWSGAHQDGGKVGKGAKLPARTYLWMSDKFLKTAEKAFAEHAVKGW